MKTIDLNCDLGEWRAENGLQKDAAIMPFISSCNIACGGHIGDNKSMLATLRLAMKHRVALGAHPSYPDRKNFGRVVLDIQSDKLRDSLLNQLNSFFELVDKESGSVHHIKPHGALYNEAARNRKVAETVVQAFFEFDQKIPIYCQEGSELAKVLADAGIPVMHEVFADRAYEDNLTLRSRKLEKAIIHEKEEVINHIHRMVIEAKVRTFSGLIKPIIAETMCLHSDTEGSIELAKSIFEYLKKKGVNIAAA